MGRSDRARRALAHLPEVDPGLASLALWCTHRDGAEATYTAGDTIWYGPEFPALALHEQVGLLGHHVLHVALRHSWRMGAMATGRGETFDPDLFNAAADALVNDALLAAGHGLPRPCVTLADLLGQAGDLADWDVERLYHAMMRQGGRGAGDRPRVARDLAPDPGGGDADPEAADWRGRVEAAQAMGRAAGRGIGSGNAALGDLPSPRAPWARVLRGLVARHLAAMPVRSHRRPDRQWIAAEALACARGGPATPFQPGQQRVLERPLVAIGLDTSGSVDRDQLHRLAGEIAGIVRRAGARAHLLAFDEEVYHDMPLNPAFVSRDLARLKLRQGGGTAFADVLARAGRMNAAVAVILSDLDGAFGPPPGLPVVWATETRHRATVPFGRILHLDG